MLVVMTVFAVLAALALATSAGYHWGRRVGSTPTTWKKRTSRVALGRQALSLAALIAARHVERRLRAEAVGALSGLTILTPVPQLLRGSVTRMRSYRGAPGW
jgi:hypothetical protein